MDSNFIENQSEVYEENIIDVALVKKDLNRGIGRAVIYLLCLIIAGYIAYRFDLSQHGDPDSAIYTSYFGAAFVSGFVVIKLWAKLRFPLTVWGDSLFVILFHIILGIIKFTIAIIIGVFTTPVFVVWSLITIVRNLIKLNALRTA